MTDTARLKRTDFASRVIHAPRQAIYRAFVDPEAWLSWLPPSRMDGRIETFDARPGGKYRLTLTYLRPERDAPGKTSDLTDVVEGTFLELVPDERIVQRVEFESDDPAFAGAMTMTWSLEEVREGTRVTIVCENVPSGIRQEDHDVGLRSSLGNLAAYVEAAL